MNYEDLSPELREEALKCKTPEEILALAKKVGRELSSDELDAIAGGEEKWQRYQCPRCLGHDVEERTSIIGNVFYECLSCGHKWTYD